MTGIFVGIPRVHSYEPFQESLSAFLSSIRDKYDVELYEVRNKQRDDAREDIVAKFLESNKEYLLFLDDDHSGHKPEMLESLMKPNALVCSLKCYARYYPFQITICSKDIKYQDRNNLYVLNTEKGYSDCHFVGFGMALIKRELFEKIDKPYFKCNQIGEKEDNYFCENLTKNGIQPVGCFDFALPHCGIDDNTVLGFRQKGIKDFIKRQHQRYMIQRIQNGVNDGSVVLNEEANGKMQVADILLNTEIILTGGN